MSGFPYPPSETGYIPCTKHIGAGKVSTPTISIPTVPAAAQNLTTLPSAQNYGALGFSRLNQNQHPMPVWPRIPLTKKENRHGNLPE